MTKRDITLSRNLDGLMNSSKKVKCLVAVAAIGIPLVWLLYTMLLLGFGHAFLPESLQNLSKPTTFAEFGEAFTALEGLASSLALVLGLAAILLQVKYSHSQNQLSALSARLQFLVADYQRLDSGIAKIYRDGDKTKYSVARGMQKRRSRIKYELENTDLEVRKLLVQLGLLTDDCGDSPINAGDEDQIKENVNKHVLVVGTVDTVVRFPKDQRALLTFKCLDVMITDELLRWLEPLEKYERQEIWVQGKLERNKADSNGRPVIWVSKASKIEQIA